MKTKKTDENRNTKGIRSLSLSLTARSPLLLLLLLLLTNWRRTCCLLKRRAPCLKRGGRGRWEADGGAGPAAALARLAADRGAGTTTGAAGAAAVVVLVAAPRRALADGWAGGAQGPVP